MTTLTTNQINKINAAIKETEQLLAKELSYSEDLQNIKMVNFYRNHITTLKSMINE